MSPAAQRVVGIVVLLVAGMLSLPLSAFFLVDPELSGALTFSTVLSIPFAIDGLVPQIAAAVDGDPATTPTG